MIIYQKKNVTIFQSKLYHTTSVVIETKDAVILTDPTWLPEEIEEIRQFVTQKKGDKELFIIFTHSDWDHIIGYGAFPDAEIIASEAFDSNEHKTEKMEQIHQFHRKKEFEPSYSVSYPYVDNLITENGQTIDIGEVTLTFYKAPGHTPDGLFTVIEPNGIFLAGDYLSDTEYPFIYDSFSGYMETMKKAKQIIEQKSITLLVPGHGNPTEETPEMANRVKDSIDYLEALRVNDNEIEAILKRRYPNYEATMKGNHHHNLEMVKKSQ
jgi:hydroxyacylglutathione hydrolase